MSRMQVGIIAKRDPETGQFGPAMPIYKDIDDSTPMDPVLAAEFNSFAKMLAQKFREYRTGTNK